MADTTVKRCKQAHFNGDTFVPVGTIVGSLNALYTPATHQQFFEDVVVLNTA
jgi:hypothetical protein